MGLCPVRPDSPDRGGSSRGAEPDGISTSVSTSVDVFGDLFADPATAGAVESYQARTRRR